MACYFWHWVTKRLCLPFWAPCSPLPLSLKKPRGHTVSCLIESPMWQEPTRILIQPTKDWAKKSIFSSWEPGAHTCNLIYLGGWDWEYQGSRSDKKDRQSFQDPLSLKKSWVWWYMSVIPTMVGGLRSRPFWVKSKTLSPKLPEPKGLEIIGSCGRDPA
jgi:hypothetical protein